MNNCILNSIFTIFVTMLLGDGFDMLEQVMVEGRPWLVALLVIYMLLGAIILLNGLIGIFGRSFSTEGDGDDVNTNYLTTRQLERECMTTLSELKATQAEMMMMIKEMRPQAAVKVSNGINTAAVDLI